MNLLHYIRHPLFILFAVFLVSITVLAIITALFTPVDFVVTNDYVVIDTGKELIVMTELGKCVRLSEVYLPLHTLAKIEHVVKMNGLLKMPKSLSDFIEIAPLTGINVTAITKMGTINSTYVCGLVVIRYG